MDCRPSLPSPARARITGTSQRHLLIRALGSKNGREQGGGGRVKRAGNKIFIIDARSAHNLVISVAHPNRPIPPSATIKDGEK